MYFYTDRLAGTVIYAPEFFISKFRIIAIDIGDMNLTVFGIVIQLLNGLFLYAGQNAADFRTVRQYIDAGNLAAAQAKLDSIPIKNAEWIFLSGMISYRKGWYDDAVSKVDQAISMDPNNQEYRVIRMQMRRPGQMFQQQAYGQGYGNQDPFCQALQAMICIDCLCPCF